MIFSFKNLFKISILFCASIVAAQITPAPKSYVAYKTSAPISIDGKANETDWKNASFTANFTDIEGDKTPKYQTNVKILWDDENLYFYAELKEPHVWGTLKQRDTVIFHNNDFEIFIDPDGDSHNYMEFEINALNTIWDLFLVKPYRDAAPVLDGWDIHGIKTEVSINGTLNNPKDTDEGWSVEIAMPWKSIYEAGNKKVPANDFWRINFSRVNWDHVIINGKYQRKKDKNGKRLPEYNWVWSPQYVIAMHEPEKWGYVYFSDHKTSEPFQFEIPKDEQLKWLLFDLYRAQKSYQNKNKKWAANISEIGQKSYQIDGKMVTPVLENYNSGWTISVKSPFTNATYQIKEDSKLTTIK
ncbi:Carbohydrate family 9 binding domain-like [Pustulibacterium marinum]|uniref:Carbohydrate family 9 binding domain-like n=1 Tax=Pustulibacterium marinum TaxID=1224947 RepID=A0A1I7G495_9FLAO|nr:carbohydrate-binding family 9-like protein [Pustulibacterium marinum]SFU43274.1 Carbohydrate family 9 binding domain-like [Pustulibacterium marinum]